MNWLKAITRSGRRSLAKELLKEYVTPDAISAWAANGVNGLLDRIKNKERLGSVALNIERGSSLLASLSAAIKDSKVTPQEAADIQAQGARLVVDLVRPAQIDALIDKVVSYVP